MRMRDRDRLDAAEALDHGHGRGIERGDAIPQHIAAGRAHQQRALADGEAGCEPMPITPGSYSRKLFMWLCASASSVVQLWPRGGTYCRSSSQMTHCAGGLSLGGYCVPQAVQMKAGMDVFNLVTA